MTAPGGDRPPHPGPADGPVCLDCDATTPVEPRVAAAVWPYLTDFSGNPSSGHPHPESPRPAPAKARAQVTALLDAEPGEIVFTGSGSGSEADPLALRGPVLASGRPHPHVITRATEHPAGLETCRALDRLHGARVTVLRSTAKGSPPRRCRPTRPPRTRCWLRTTRPA